MNSTIAAVFGSDVINSDGEVNRKKLGDIVFNDPVRMNFFMYTNSNLFVFNVNLYCSLV